jgi:hypothetical protein
VLVKILLFVCGLFVGFMFGFALAVIGQFILEQQWEESGIAKINRKMYRIKRIEEE